MDGEYFDYTVKSAYILSLYELNDESIFRLAKENANIILISKDADFPELISRLGAPPKLIYLKIGNCDNRNLWNLLKPHIEEAIKTLTLTDISIVEIR